MTRETLDPATTLELGKRIGEAALKYISHADEITGNFAFTREFVSFATEITVSKRELDREDLVSFASAAYVVAHILRYNRTADEDHTLGHITVGGWANLLTVPSEQPQDDLQRAMKYIASETYIPGDFPFRDFHTVETMNNALDLIYTLAVKTNALVDPMK